MVFNDLDGDGTRDPSEGGIGGVTVELLGADGNVVAPTTTGADGSYNFTGVAPGNYTVRETDPNGFTSTTPNTVPVTVTPGGTATANFGDRAGTTARLSLTKTASPDPVPPGENLAFMLTVTNSGNAAATGLVLIDPLPGNVTFVSASDGGVFTNGVVTWNLGTLAAGASRSVILSVTADPNAGDGTLIVNTAQLRGDQLTVEVTATVTVEVGLPIPVPTLSHWALLALALTLIVLSRARLRRHGGG